MHPPPVDLLSELKDASLYSSAILGTYQFHGAFFENRVLPALQRLDVGNTVVLADTEQYHASEEVRRAGERYYFDHVRCSNIFHPKFLLLLGRTRGFALLGSANLTESGWRRNGELVSILKYDNTSSNPEVTQFFWELHQFVNGIATTDRLPSRRTREAIQAAFDDAPWIGEPSSDTEQRSVRLLHNIEAAILPQVIDYLADRTVETVHVLSPYYSGENIRTLEALCELEPEELILHLQAERVQGFRSDKLNDGRLRQTPITLRETEMADDESRFVHAKILIFKGPEGALALYGSPNLTTPALLRPAENGNIELAILRLEDDPTYFNYLLDEQVVSQGSLEPSAVAHRPGSFNGSSTAADVELLECYLDKDRVLNIHYESVGAKSATVRLSRAEGVEELVEPVEDLSDGQLRVDTEEVADFCHTATLVSVTFDTGQATLESDSRWIALPTLGSVPRRGEIQNIEASRGRHGLIEVMNRLEGWESLYHFLESLDLNQLASGRGGVGGLPQLRDDEPAGGGMDERPVIELSELLESKVEGFRSEIERSAVPPEGTETWEAQFHDVVNLYIGGSKVALWWADRDRNAIEKLSHVRIATEDLMNFVKQMRLMADESFAYEVEEDHQLLEHLCIIACLVDRLQVRSGFPEGPNHKVYDIFRSTSRQAIHTAAQGRNRTIPSEESIADCLDEYDGTVSRLPSVNAVKHFCRSLL